MRSLTGFVAVVLVMLTAQALIARSARAQEAYFLIEVRDADTGAPVPCVELTTTHGIVHASDRNGAVAFYEPGLMGRWVFFSVAREGYSFPPDGFGFAGKSLFTAEGGAARLDVTRTGEPGACAAGDVDTRLSLRGVPAPHEMFEIEVVDRATGRGVPLVEIAWAEGRGFTDSAGRLAFFSLDHMDALVGFDVASDGYASPASPVVLFARSGGFARIEIDRTNVAERLYRITGAGIYRDSWLLGYEPPTREPLIDTSVAGLDNVLATIHRGRIFWVWGDTRWPEHPLGNFRATAATSLLPSEGGLAPDVGVDLDYFADEAGRFVKQMAPTETMPNPGPGPFAVWINGLTSIPDAFGEETLFASYGIFDPGLNAHERGVARFDEAREVFETAVVLGPGDLALPEGPSFRWWHGDTEFVYFRDFVRVPATEEALLDPSRYEAFTGLQPGSERTFERDASGRAVYDWKARTPAITRRSLDQGLAGTPPEDLLIGHVRDPDSGVPLIDHKIGSIAWNEHRGRFVRMVMERRSIHGRGDDGPSSLGEVWYAEADTPMGPWVYARKVVGHAAMSFISPRHNSFFDEAGGRVVYFEATYWNWLAGQSPTPRYDYNQIMYRLDLNDERLVLPVPVYAVSQGGRRSDFVTKRSVKPWMGADLAAFFAADRPRDGLVPVWWSGPACAERRLVVGGVPETEPSFHAHPPDASDRSPDTIGLYELRHPWTGERIYTTDPSSAPPGFVRRAEPIAWVWPNPIDHPLPSSEYLPDLVAHAGPDRCVRERVEGGGRVVLLHAARSVARQSPIVHYAWTNAAGAQIAEGRVVWPRLPVGLHEITLTVTAEDGSRASDRVLVEVGEPARRRRRAGWRAWLRWLRGLEERG